MHRLSPHCCWRSKFGNVVSNFYILSITYSNIWTVSHFLLTKQFIKRGGSFPERKCILNIKKSIFPAVLNCFSRFSDFLNFSRFSSALLVNFYFLAWFPARGYFQIDPAWNFICIHIFLFIMYSCADLELPKSRCLCLGWSSRFACANIFT